MADAHAAGILLNPVDADTVSIATDETTTYEDILAVATVFGAGEGSFAYIPVTSVPAALARQDEFLTHPRVPRAPL